MQETTLPAAPRRVTLPAYRRGLLGQGSILLVTSYPAGWFPDPVGRFDYRYFDGTTYMDYLTGSGLLRTDQLDGSYDGTPAAFIAASTA